MHKPLAEQIRPESIEEFVGQDHLKTRIKAMVLGRRLQSTLFFGPPGCGKSTLAMIIARGQGKRFVRLSAPEVGLAELRKKISDTDILILDELHRFSKAQQDFFLPLLETGEIVLLGTTTENPSFSVTRQLLSRMNVIRLRALSQSELMEIARRGQGTLEKDIPEKSMEMLASLAGGDARTFLNLMEYVLDLDPEDME
ncbi:MAG: AAA family ATPase, partial [Desulfonatronovibrio sp.]